MRIGIIDYGVGNVGSVFNAFWNAGEDPELVSTPEAILSCDRLVLPGVGTPRPAMAGLAQGGKLEALTEAVHKKGVPLMGICLGMQLLADTLHEYGTTDGLGWIPGEVVHLRDVCGDADRVPHLGWGEIKPIAGLLSPLHGIGGNLYFYYAHSYVFRPSDEANVVAYSDHGGQPFCAAVMKGNVFATQFHPEKSQAKGERVIQNFIAWEP